MRTTKTNAVRATDADRKARLMVDLLAPLLARGATLREMAGWLTEHRVLTPSGRGIVWSHQTVASLLRRAGVDRVPCRSPIGRLREQPDPADQRPRPEAV